MGKETVIYSGNEKLSAILQTPENTDLNREKLPIIILCHGHSRHKNDGLDVLSKRLVLQNIAVLRFDFSGCGKQAVNRYHLYCMTNWVKDLISAISFAYQLPFVIKNKIGVVGISMGATTAVYTASVDKRICGVVSMAGITDCEAWLENVWEKSGASFNSFKEKCENARGMKALSGQSVLVNTLDMYNYPKSEIKKAFIEEFCDDDNINSFVTLDSIASLMEFKPIHSVQYIKCPMFYIHGKDDNLVPKEYAKELYDKTTSSKSLKIYDNIDHNIPKNPNRDSVFEDIVKWFDSIFQI